VRDFVKKKKKPFVIAVPAPPICLATKEQHRHIDERVRNEVIFIMLPNIAFFVCLEKTSPLGGNKQNKK
jgi:hypothetical protein